MSNHPKVGIIMGSDSDLPIMKKAVDVLKEFSIPYEITVVSAHRTPERMMEYGKTAEERGLKVIIAGAGGAAHLPGMIASISLLPVIGVPILSSNSIKGIDSLLSIVQMPGGVPVATVGIDNAKNAALLAARILAGEDDTVKENMRSFIKKQEEKVMEMVKKMNSDKL
ncbi:MAG: 5-(carboxyamino)imidazole ribonucleotide mutase [Candidatus Gracilibacteria bacterium]|nr:5-(carboxyamino)imidazole ribonucleotide mutase [Candidatus Gracilibacteria bacterium]